MSRGFLLGILAVLGLTVPAVRADASGAMTPTDAARSSQTEAPVAPSVESTAASPTPVIAVPDSVALEPMPKGEPGSGSDAAGEAAPGEGVATKDDVITGDDTLADDPLLDEEFESENSVVRDPLESMNRGVFAFNNVLDDYGWTPLMRAYQFLLPDPMRHGIHRMFLNIGTPVLLVNQMLQLRPVDGATTLGRFVLNSTVGVMGFFDPAAHGAGWERCSGDFGQTMAVWGVHSGPYLMIPIFGPSTARDAVGGAFDFALDPMLYIVGPVQWFLLLGTTEGLAVREANADALDALEASSVDFYAALRSAYLQARAAEVASASAKNDAYVLR